MTRFNSSSLRLEWLLITSFSFFYYSLQAAPLFLATNLIDRLDVGFGTDPMRVLDDITNPHPGPRTYLHPLCIIIFQPVYRALYSLTEHMALSLLVMQSMAAACIIGLLLHYLQLLKLPNPARWGLISIYIFSSTQFLRTVFLDSFIFSGATIVLLHYLFFRLQHKTSGILTLAAIGVSSISLNITGYFQFLIRLVFRQRKAFPRFPDFLNNIALVIALSLTISYGLALLQKQWFPNTTVFLDYFLGNEAVTNPHSTTVPDDLNEWRFVRTGPYVFLRDAPDLKTMIHGYFSMETLDRVTHNMLVRSFLVEGIARVGGNRQYVGWLTFKYTDPIAIGWATIFFGMFFASCALLIKCRHPMCWPLLLCLIFNLLLHSVYSSIESWLYTPHFAFIYILLIAHGIAAITSEKLRVQAGYLLVLLSGSAMWYNFPEYYHIIRFFIHYYPA